MRYRFNGVAARRSSLQYASLSTLPFLFLVALCSLCHIASSPNRQIASTCPLSLCNLKSLNAHPHFHNLYEKTSQHIDVYLCQRILHLTFEPRTPQCTSTNVVSHQARREIT